MNFEEIGKLLAICAAFDYRKSDEVDIIAWHDLFNSVEGAPNFVTARRRVLEWYAHHRERIMPSDVIHPRNQAGMW